MSSGITRFYLEPSKNNKPEDWRAFEDVGSDEANEYEQSLHEKGIEYIRIDLLPNKIS